MERELLDFITKWGEFDGGHHKQWVLDQLLRMILKEEYEEYISYFNRDDNYDAWDEGIAP